MLKFLRGLYESLAFRTILWVVIPVGFVLWGFHRSIGFISLQLINESRWSSVTKAVRIELESNTIPLDSLNSDWVNNRRTIDYVGRLSFRILDAKDSVLCSTDGNFDNDSSVVGSIPITTKSGDELTIEYIEPEESNDDLSVGYKYVFIVFDVIVLFFVILSIIIIINRQLKPLKHITNAAIDIANGNLDAPLPVIKSRTEIRKLRDAFEHMQHSLKQYINMLSITTEKRVSLERDLSIAAKIQQDMVPKSFPELSNIDLYGMLQPAKSVGGDLFDVLVRKVKDKDGNECEKLFFCIGDVSGKGVPAALFMSAIAHLFHAVADRTDSPADILSFINKEMNEGNEQNMFCTLFVGILNLNTGLLEYSNAGHNAPIFRTSFLKVLPGIPVGVFPEAEYINETLQMSAKDILFMYTDGVSEAENVGKNLFGDDRTLDMVSKSQSMDMKSLATFMVESVHAYAMGTEQSDDITVLCLKWK